MSNRRSRLLLFVLLAFITGVAGVFWRPLWRMVAVEREDLAIPSELLGLLEVGRNHFWRGRVHLLSGQKEGRFQVWTTEPTSRGWIPGSVTVSGQGILLVPGSEEGLVRILGHYRGGQPSGVWICWDRFGDPEPPLGIDAEQFSEEIPRQVRSVSRSPLRDRMEAEARSFLGDPKPAERRAALEEAVLAEPYDAHLRLLRLRPELGYPEPKLREAVTAFGELGVEPMFAVFLHAEIDARFGKGREARERLTRLVKQGLPVHDLIPDFPGLAKEVTANELAAFEHQYHRVAERFQRWCERSGFLDNGTWPESWVGNLDQASLRNLQFQIQTTKQHLAQAEHYLDIGLLERSRVSLRRAKSLLSGVLSIRYASQEAALVAEARRIELRLASAQAAGNR